jgi:hypothetical protein
VEANAQLLDGQLREARRTAEQTMATLSLLLSLVAAARESGAGVLRKQLIEDLLICAEAPELAIEIAGCEREAVDPQMIRASAALLAGQGAAMRPGPGRATAH